MRLLGAAHVRNEADIVEAFVRHNLVLLDGIAIVDHASVDATPDILRALKDEGLPIFLARDESPTYASKRCRTGWSVICFRRRRQRGFFRSTPTSSCELHRATVRERNASLHWKEAFEYLDPGGR